MRTVWSSQTERPTIPCEHKKECGRRNTTRNCSLRHRQSALESIAYVHGSDMTVPWHWQGSVKSNYDPCARIMIKLSAGYIKLPVD